MGRVEFPSTIWEQIRDARDRKTDAQNRLFERYREPVFQFVLRQGYSDADADDLTQEVFLRMVEADLLERADQAKGHFRSLVLGVTKNVLREAWRRGRAAKRGGGHGPLSLEDGLGGGETPLLELLAAPIYDETFDTLWAGHLVSLALKVLEAGGASEEYRALAGYVREKPSYAELGERLGRTEDEVRSLIRRGRVKLSRAIQKEIESYSSSRQEIDLELLYLRKFLGPAG